MTLKETERKQLRRIEEFGLVREVTHERQWKYDIDGKKRVEAFVVDIDGHDTTGSGIVVNGITWITLHKKDMHAEWIESHGREGVHKLERESLGIALCSQSDNYNKALGRVRATERALEQLQ